jgi:photosystem II stability/assembly factor-like uncharacterized protein
MNPSRTTISGRRAASCLAAVLAFAALAGGCSKPTQPIVIPPIAKVVLTPATDTLQVGQGAVFTATAYDTSLVAVSVPIDWSSSSPAVATVNISGHVLAQGEGTALLIAAVGGKSDTSTVAVFPDTGWIAQTSNALEDLHGVFFQPDGRTGWIAGGAGLILTTYDAGLTWTRQLPTTFSLNAVWFMDGMNGCVVGNSGTVLTSDDGGLSWTRSNATFSSENLYAVTFAHSDSLIGWAVGQNGVVLRTLDRGVTWTKQFVVAGQTLRGVSFAGTKDGWAVGDNGVIAGTHDRGLTWFVVQPSVTIQSLRAVWRANELRAVAVGAAGVAPRTWVPPADSISWTLDNAGAQFQLNGVSFGDSVVYAAGSNAGVGAVLRSDDFGVSWTPQTPRSQYPLNAAFFVDRQRGWVVGNSGTIRHTARGGGQ